MSNSDDKAQKLVEQENADLRAKVEAFEAKEKAEKEAKEKALSEAREAEKLRIANRGKVKNFALTRICQVNGVLCDPKGNGAFIKKLPIDHIEPCKACNGTGKDEVCRSCKNEAVTGEVLVQGRVIKCTTCGGTGKVSNQECEKCKGTKRSYPPHHYVEVDSDGDLIFEDDDEATKVEDLREQIKELDGDYDGRWGSVKLEQELVDLKKTKGVI